MTQDSWTRKRWFVGYKVTGGYEVFSSMFTPTNKSHGHLYGFVIGPYRTRRKAIDNCR